VKHLNGFGVGGTMKKMIDFDALMNTAPPMLSDKEAQEIRCLVKALLHGSDHHLYIAIDFDPDFAQTVAMTLMAGLTELEDEA